MGFTNESEALQAFIVQCEEFKNSRLVMVQQKTRMLLKCLAYYDELRALVEQCTSGFVYDREYSKCIINLGTSIVFRLPSSNKKKVALTVALLLDFDEPRRDFVRFIREFFPAATHDESYRAFCENVITPFEEAVTQLLKAPDEKAKKNTAFETDAKAEEINIALSEQAASYLKSASEAVTAAHLTEGTRDDIIFMLDNFLTVLKLRDAQIIRGYWLGLRATLKNYKLVNKFIENMEELLKSYNAF